MSIRVFKLIRGNLSSVQVTENDYVVYKHVLLNEAINNDQSSHYLLKDPRQKQSDNRPSCYCYFFNKLLIAYE